MDLLQKQLDFSARQTAQLTPQRGLHAPINTQGFFVPAAAGTGPHHPADMFLAPGVSLIQCTRQRGGLLPLLVGQQLITTVGGRLYQLLFQ